jgi:two-component system, NtrC family, response regulator HydG
VMVAEGTFREDLYYRLNVVTIRMPSLRERKEDIPLLTEHFLQRYLRAMSRPPLVFAPQAMDLLIRHEWPGNVRELQNAVERAVVICRGGRIEPTDLPFAGEPAAGPGGRTLADAERVHVEGVLREAKWNISQAARALDIDRVTLYNKIRRYRLQRPSE